MPAKKEILEQLPENIIKQCYYDNIILKNEARLLVTYADLCRLRGTTISLLIMDQGITDIEEFTSCVIPAISDPQNVYWLVE
jgi:hypothetical protein